MTAAKTRRQGAEHVSVRRIRLDDDTGTDAPAERKPHSSVLTYKLPGGQWRQVDLSNGKVSQSTYDPYAAAERLADALEAAK